MPAPQKIIDLVENFDRNIDQLKRAQNETQVRVEFIDPMFSMLGWDMDNSIGAAMQYQDVIHEDQLKIGGTSKAPDYGFRIGGTLKFFVEAKKPSVYLKEDSAPAYQVRNYGWNKKLSICVLTDFEEFAIYDCTVKPKPTDKPSVARVDYFTYKDYINKWDEIAGIFSKDSVIKGNFDKFAAGSKGKRGTTTVDKDILLTIEHWREILAKNIAKNNKISEEELKFATQRILDRIIFLRICEARAIEEDGRLLEAVKNNNSFKNLFNLFQAADNRYNSGLFYFRKGDKAHKSDAELDTITPNLKLDDKIIKEIVENLYYPKSQYLFDVIPADILGQVYEQFLGKVIRMTPGGLVKIEEKPEVRKAGGVYYTPTYIVDYIVKNTVGKMLEENTGEGTRSVPLRRGTLRVPNSLAILDPACGSGSFLLGAYNYLLNWYLHEYSLDAKKLLAQKNSPIYEIGNGTYALTTPERKRILLEHIYGVDIDEQAVEVAKLNLMLKCLEGEAGTNLKLSVERILPDLSDNIKCGNSLIGPDFSDGLFLGEDKKINPFNWNAEFPEIMKKGGFDVVIGNPPYIRIQNLREFQPQAIPYFEQKYSSAIGKYDIYVLFLERAPQLLGSHGVFGYIVPNKLLISDYGTGIRKHLTSNGHVIEIISFEALQVFEQATIYTSLVFWNKTLSGTTDYVRIKSLENAAQNFSRLSSGLESESYQRSKYDITNSTTTWNFSTDPAETLILELANRWPKFKEYTDRVFQGIITGGDRFFIFKKISEKGGLTTVWSEELEKEIQIESNLMRPFLRGANIRRFGSLSPEYLIFFPYKLQEEKTVFLTESELKKNYSYAWNYLSSVKKELAQRGSSSMKYPMWYALWNPRDIRLLEAPKILVPTIALRPEFSYDFDGSKFFLGSGAGGPGAYGILCKEGVDPLYMTALLNSRVTSLFINATSSIFQGGYRAYSQQYLWEIPFRPINSSNPKEKELHDKLVSLVDRMLELNKELPKTKTPNEKTRIERLIAATDSEIDKLVYELYGLSEEEIKVVEGN